MELHSTPPVDGGAAEIPEPDVHVVTSTGLLISEHSKFLAAASPALESMINRPQKRRSSERKIPILGVPDDAVSMFIQFLYSYRAAEELARLCDAPHLHLKCMNMLSTNFNALQETEGWKFVHNHDPFLELQILQSIDQSESMKKRIRRRREVQSLYIELSEAMCCLDHICSEDCTGVGPRDMDLSKEKGPCSKFSTCHGLQLLIKHVGGCKKRVNGGCLRCKRMWQLFRLHSSICDHYDECRVPLCRKFKSKEVRDGGEIDELWRLLVRKVALAKAIMSLPKRKREEDPIKSSDGLSKFEKLKTMKSTTKKMVNFNLQLIS
ncbi:BTB/POZ and TAZ domain-containing protein 1-like isoform X1 [Salvia divinorum]|uniref:BTB/POZ and TAZ domain-containing protein 1-like isoform X1 n=1 Tax=Salvia divinorum TaxID=28513 RepID=A0ABD1FSF6_SALDI